MRFRRNINLSSAALAVFVLLALVFIMIDGKEESGLIMLQGSGPSMKGKSGSLSHTTPAGPENK
jgi:hypothetical protein